VTRRPSRTMPRAVRQGTAFYPKPARGSRDPIRRIDRGSRTEFAKRRQGTTFHPKHAKGSRTVKAAEPEGVLTPEVKRNQNPEAVARGCITLSANRSISSICGLN
jgi:hypothetical protein